MQIDRCNLGLPFENRPTRSESGASYLQAILVPYKIIEV